MVERTRPARQAGHNGRREGRPGPVRPVRAAGGVLAVVWLAAGLVSLAAALIAVRSLPGPVIVGVLVAALGGVAVVTAWPLPGRVRRFWARWRR